MKKLILHLLFILVLLAACKNDAHYAFVVQCENTECPDSSSIVIPGIQPPLPQPPVSSDLKSKWLEEIKKSPFYSCCPEITDIKSIASKCRCDEVLKKYEQLRADPANNAVKIRQTDLILSACCDKFGQECDRIENPSIIKKEDLY
jgi:hypothetical protein